MKIRNLALCNDQLNSLLSFPFLIFLSMNVLNFIITLSLFIFDINVKKVYRIYIYLSYLVGLSFYGCYTTKLNQDNLNLFNSICFKLWDSNCIKPNQQKISFIGKKRLNVTHSRPFLYSREQTRQSQQILYYGIEQYGRLLQMRLFHLTPLNLSVLFSIFLLVFSHIVFILQTN